MDSRRVIVTSRTALIVTALAACATSQPAPDLEPNPPHCADVVARARANPQLPGVAPPRIRRIAVVRERVPPSLNGTTYEVRVVIDEEGQPEFSTLEIVGMPDAAYARAVRESMRQYRFEPSMMEGCRVAQLHRHRTTLSIRR